MIKKELRSPRRFPVGKLLAMTEEEEMVIERSVMMKAKWFKRE